MKSHRVMKRRTKRTIQSQNNEISQLKRYWRNLKNSNKSVVQHYQIGRFSTISIGPKQQLEREKLDLQKEKEGLEEEIRKGEERRTEMESLLETSTTEHNQTKENMEVLRQESLSEQNRLQE